MKQTCLTSVWYSFLFSLQQLDTVLNIIKDGFFVCLPYLDFVYISCDMRKRYLKYIKSGCLHLALTWLNLNTFLGYIIDYL